MLHGEMPSLGDIIDPIGCEDEDYLSPVLEKSERDSNRDCNFSSADFYNQIQISKLKTEFNDESNRLSNYEKALYGSFCGNTDSMLDVSHTWDDTLWSYLKTVFFWNVTEKYTNLEDEYLEVYNMTHGDFYGSDQRFKDDFKNWEFPQSCPTNFEGILANTVEKMPMNKLSFKNRESNPFFEVISIFLQLQLYASKSTVEDANRWNILVDLIHNLNDIKKFELEDLIFLRFSAHLLILLNTLKRIEPSKIEKYNDVIFKYINSEEEIDSPIHAFYLNFIIGDENKVNYYSDQIYTITDRVIQDRILANIDQYIPHLKEDLKGNFSL